MATMSAGSGVGEVTGEKQIVLITGVSRGLGRSLALELAKLGHTIIGCSRTQEKLDSLRSQLSSDQNDDKHLLMVVDVSSNSSVDELADAVVQKYNDVPDIIGIINESKRLWDLPVEEFDAVIDTNIKGTANIMRHFIPLMIPSKQGIIVNMSSEWGRSAAAHVAPYCASKWAVEGLSKSVAKELPSGFAVVALDPGVINTEMLVSCYGSNASKYQMPETWAPEAATVILNLTEADNGASLIL